MFDESFLKDRLAKQKKWKAKGIKAGNGRSFSDHVDVSKRDFDGKDIINPSMVTSTLIDNSLVSSPSTIAINNLESWLVDIINHDPVIQSGLMTKKAKVDSPHKLALIELAKKPELLKGNIEHYIQVRIFYMIERDYPNVYQLVKAVPNGGLRGKLTAHKLKCEGQKAGWPDIDIFAPRGAYHGMCLEVKAKNGHLQQNQNDYIKLLVDNGYYVVYGKGFDQCFDLIKAYLALPPFDNKTKLAEEVSE